MQSSLYIYEINIICVIILSLIFKYYNFKTMKHSTREMIFNSILLCSIFLCFFDMSSEFFSGKLINFNHFLLEISTDLYYICMTLICYSWLNYVYICVLRHDLPKYLKYILRIPILIFVFIVFTNHFTHFLFIIDKENIYHRSGGIYIHWVVSWIYIILATLLSVYVLLCTKSKYRRKEILPYLYFIITPVIASVIQMNYYGFSLFQVGITISLLMIFFSYQNYMIQKDPLTGLKNRNVLEQYLDHLISPVLSSLSILMIDINKFKEINDEYGHLIGDQALQKTSQVLNEYFMKNYPAAQLYRYGGDEFLIMHVNLNKRELEKIKQDLLYKFQTLELPYSLTVSIGYGYGNVYSEETIKELFQEADQNMYEHKRKN